MSNQLDNPNGSFHVVVNGEGQYSIWPESADVPAGWTVSHGPTDRSSGLDYINAHWTDMRPLSLVAHMEQQTAGDCPKELR
ncbi:MbtH protein [Streptomyces sp. 2131.1]|uniref:MbtH family protein n=1 Tax=Streptomyces sp. 2131.1 TaxID=1855346 RepID=UPI0008970AA7|nr:MbtH family protein [Streptomyces sp. 2131.1]SEE29833.1 MbtH protein [Streptomyces sp. 2131.1]